MRGDAIDVGVDLGFVELAKDGVADLVAIAVGAAVQVVDRHAENLAAQIMNSGVDAGTQRLLKGIDDRIDPVRVEWIGTADLLVEPVLELVHVGKHRIVAQIGHLPDADRAIIRRQGDDDVGAHGQRLAARANGIEPQLRDLHARSSR